MRTDTALLDLLVRLVEAGVDATSDGGNIWLRSAEPIDPGLVAEVERRDVELAGLLRRTPRGRVQTGSKVAVVWF